MGIIETHAHIYLKEFDEDRQEVIDRALEEGVDKILMPNINSESIPNMLAVEKENPTTCIPMIGLHPCYVKEDFEQELAVMKEWLDKRSFVAIGEIGMDLHWDTSFLDQQKEAFKIQTNWAIERGLPIAIHARKANQELLEVLEGMDTSKLTGVFHCFSGTVEEANRVKALGFYLGVGGVVTFKNGGLDKVISELGFDKLILETDAPYLAPVPNRGKRNDLVYINQVAEKLAQLFDMSYDEVVEKTTANANALFKL